MSKMAPGSLRSRPLLEPNQWVSSGCFVALLLSATTGLAGELGNSLYWVDTCYALHSATICEFLDTHSDTLFDPATIYAWAPNGYPWPYACYPWIEFDMQELSDSGVVTTADIVYLQSSKSGAAENVVTLVATGHYFQQWDSMMDRIVTGAHCSDTLSWPPCGLVHATVECDRYRRH